MELYLHDSAVRFQFQLRGRLEGASVEDLEHAWSTASSVMDGKHLEVDISSLSSADDAGINLLSRMQQAGAMLTTPEGSARELGWLRRPAPEGVPPQPLRAETGWSFLDLFRPRRWYRPLRNS
ncbi:MAG TPA: hypothetical protein VHI52_00545 [Verrucomicrobiae bacterium]|jgi:hypothetical protein|nr:hypothetical protein [Verrucomicrobiae bacterium]HWB95078.1 hypothetical protein [Bryobacteraceae bacterium]